MTYLRMNITALALEKRKNEILKAIKRHNKNINQLFEYACGIKTLKNKGYTYASESYQRTPEDNQRLFSTVNNLRQQIITLEKELRRIEARVG